MASADFVERAFDSPPAGNVFSQLGNHGLFSSRDKNEKT
jgi:hypothetical protein